MVFVSSICRRLFGSGLIILESVQAGSVLLWAPSWFINARCVQTGAQVHQFVPLLENYTLYSKRRDMWEEPWVQYGLSLQHDTQRYFGFVSKISVSISRSEVPPRLNPAQQSLNSSRTDPEPKCDLIQTALSSAHCPSLPPESQLTSLSFSCVMNTSRYLLTLLLVFSTDE